MPLWNAWWPLNGSWRSPKYEEMWPSFTGRPSGRICSSSFFDSSAFSSAASWASREEIFCSRPFSSRVQIRRLHGGADVGLGTADGRGALEIEFAVVDVRHLREAFAQRVETDDVGIHLADAHRDRVDAALQLGLQFLDLGLLLGQGLRPGGDAARACVLLSPILSPRLNAVARMAIRTVANADRRRTDGRDSSAGHDLRGAKKR